MNTFIAIIIFWTAFAGMTTLDYKNTTLVKGVTTRTMYTIIFENKINKGWDAYSIKSNRLVYRQVKIWYDDQIMKNAIIAIALVIIAKCSYDYLYKNEITSDSQNSPLKQNNQQLIK